MKECKLTLTRKELILLGLLAMMTFAAILSHLRLQSALQVADFYQWQLTNGVFAPLPK